MTGRVHFDISIDTDAAVSLLSRLRVAISPRILLTVVGLQSIASVQDNFDAKGRLYQSGGWKPLSPNTISARRLSGRGGVMPLQDTGAMRRSVDIKGVDIFGNRSEVGFTDKKADYHHYGVRPRVIRPVSGRALAFVTARGTVIVKRVYNWPGIPARKLLPNQRLADQLAQITVDNFLRDFESS